MKKDRNCNGGAAPYPIYQPYPMGMPMQQMAPNMMPQMIPNMMTTMPSSYNTNTYPSTNTTIEQQINNMNNQIN